VTSSYADAGARQRSPWRVLVAPLLLGLIVLLANVIRFQYRQPDLAVLVLRGGVGLIAAWAVIDGLRRALGRSTFLGTGRGLDRLFGLLQVLASGGIALALLPNTLEFLDVAARFLAREAIPF
jgi:hypothetical protein